MQAAIRARFLNDDVSHIPARRDPRAVMDRIRARVLGRDQVDREVFYDPDRLAILPMGLCYPGAWKDFWPHALPLPHPSPRNNIWMRENPCFEADVLPTLRDAVNRVLSDAG
ncbi:MAG: hypothetical protein ACPGQM_13260 [Alphaproteobacteria bacterium]